MDEAIDNIYKAVQYLKEGEILTFGKNSQFVMKKDKIIAYLPDCHLTLSVDDFIDIYQKKTFYLYNDDVTIDQDKDEAYYRYYRK